MHQLHNCQCHRSSLQHNDYRCHSLLRPGHTESRQNNKTNHQVQGHNLPLKVALKIFAWGMNCIGNICFASWWLPATASAPEWWIIIYLTGIMSLPIWIQEKISFSTTLCPLNINWISSPPVTGTNLQPTSKSVTDRNRDLKTLTVWFRLTW